MQDTFAARVELYREWDHELHSRTRFFGAAALLNAALAELWPRCALARLTHGPGLKFLAGLGTDLQTFNVDMLRRIELGRWCAADWDTSLVRLEQAAVQKVLARLEQSDREMHATVVRQLDRFLYCLARRIGGSSYGPCTAVLSGGLREIQRAAPHALRFASLSDRVAVGTTLIRIVRGTAVRPLLDSAIHVSQRLLVGRAAWAGPVPSQEPKRRPRRGRSMDPSGHLAVSV